MEAFGGLLNSSLDTIVENQGDLHFVQFEFMDTRGILLFGPGVVYLNAESEHLVLPKTFDITYSGGNISRHKSLGYV